MWRRVSVKIFLKKWRLRRFLARYFAARRPFRLLTASEQASPGAAAQPIPSLPGSALRGAPQRFHNHNARIRTARANTQLLLASREGCGSNLEELWSALFAFCQLLASAPHHAREVSTLVHSILLPLRSAMIPANARAPMQRGQASPLEKCWEGRAFHPHLALMGHNNTCTCSNKQKFAQVPRECSRTQVRNDIRTCGLCGLFYANFGCLRHTTIYKIV